MRVRSSLVVAALVAVVVGDGFAVAHLRAAERADQAAERVRIDEAYVAAVVAVATQLRVVQAPVTDLELLYTSEPDERVAENVAFDVLVHGAVGADLQEVRQTLAAAQPPAARQGAHERMLGAVDGMRDAVETLADPAIANIGAELTAFETEAGLFDRELARDLEQTVAPTLTDALAPEQLTRAGVLYRWSRACARSSAELESLPDVDPDDIEGAAVELDVQSGVLQRTVEVLLAPGGPQREAVQVEREIRSPVRALLPAVESLSEFAVALRARDADALDEVLVELDLADASFEAASRGLQAYGATTCAAHLDPGVLFDQEPPADDTTET